MKYLKTFENFDDALYDILSGDDSRKRKLLDVIEPAELPDSEDGEDWSDSEREKINQKLKELSPNLVAKNGISSEVRSDNDINRAKSDAKVTLNKVKEILNDSSYRPRNSEKVSEIEMNIKKLKSVMSSSNVEDIKKVTLELGKSLRAADFRHNL